MILHLIATAPTFLLTHPYLLGLVGALLASLGLIVVVRHQLEVRRFDRTVQIAVPEHEVTSGYDGEGVYAWQCTCGAAKTDFAGDEYALLAATIHLEDTDSIPALTS
jgi:hypothetical protein